MSSEQVKRLRMRLRLTQTELAAKLGVHPISVSKWERGVVPISEPTARLLAMLIQTSKSGSR